MLTQKMMIIVVTLALTSALAARGRGIGMMGDGSGIGMMGMASPALRSCSRKPSLKLKL